MTIQNISETSNNDKFPPCDPPHKTIEDYRQKNGCIGFSIWNPVAFFRNKAIEYEWNHGGMVTTWNSKSSESVKSESMKKETTKVEIKNVCYNNKALVRGDGKILSTIDRYQTGCQNCKYFAENVNGYLKGIEGLGMYEYK